MTESGSDYGVAAWLIG